jgi:hypothetical protein
LFPYQPSYPFEALTKTIGKLGASLPERTNVEDTDEAIQD